MVLMEHEVMKGVEAALPGEEIAAVALAYPPGTTRAEAGGSAVGGGAGAATGILSGLSSVSNGAGIGGGIGLLVAEHRLNEESAAPAYVLALTASDLYILGKHRVQPLASDKDLTLLDTIPVASLSVTHRRRGLLTDITFTDTQTGQSATVECKPLGSGSREFLAALESEEVPVEG